jgi:hypothetical protein
VVRGGNIQVSSKSPTAGRMAEGKTNAEIGIILNVATRTVEKHVGQGARHSSKAQPGRRRNSVTVVFWDTLMREDQQ